MACHPKLIYECYKPKNINEAREYLLYLIDNSLLKAKKSGTLTNEHMKILGQPGCGKNLSNELLNYINIKKQREHMVLTMEPSSPDDNGKNDK